MSRYPDSIGLRPVAQRFLHAVRSKAYHRRKMDLLSAPIATAEFMVDDTQTNSLAGADSERTDDGADLVGRAERHSRGAPAGPPHLPLIIPGVAVPLSCRALPDSRENLARTRCRSVCGCG